jgi:hypothetical protein
MPMIQLKTNDFPLFPSYSFIFIYFASKINHSFKKLTIFVRIESIMIIYRNKIYVNYSVFFIYRLGIREEI